MHIRSVSHNTSFQKSIIHHMLGENILDFNTIRNGCENEPWERSGHPPSRRSTINLAPLKGALESDPVRSKILTILIQDGSWVSTTDLLRAARQVRSVVGAVTIGTILNGLNELVQSRLIISRTSLHTGIDWAEWRINPDWLQPTRKLLQMISRTRVRKTEESVHNKVQRLLDSNPSR